MWGVEDPMLPQAPQPDLMNPNMNSIWNSTAPTWNAIPPRAPAAQTPFPGAYPAGGQLAQPPPPNARKPPGMWEPTGTNTWAPQMQPPSAATPGPGAWGAPQQPPPPPQPWGMPTGGAQPNQPWASQAGSGPSYSEAARKNVPPSAATAMPHMRGGGMPAGGPRPDTANWGQGTRVDQGTPWDLGNANNMNMNVNFGGGAKPPQQGGTDWGRPQDSMVTGHWSGDGQGAPGGPAVPNAGSAGWGAGGGGGGGGMPPPQQHDSTGTAMWQRTATQTQGGQEWGQPRAQAPPGPPPPQQSGQAGWGGQQPQQQPHGAPDHNRAAQSNWDPNPQTPSMWVPPNPQEQNNDMMWVNPNPKPKKILVDKGTQSWGDPTQQGEIKRWKAAEGEGTAGAAGGANANLSTSQSSAGMGNSSSVWDSSPVAPTSTATPQTSATTGMGWGDPVQGTGSASGTGDWQRQAAQNGTAAWGQQQQPAKVSPSKSAPATGWNAPLPGQMPPDVSYSQHPAPVQQRQDTMQSSSSDHMSSVFGSAATTPMTPGPGKSMMPPSNVPPSSVSSTATPTGTGTSTMTMIDNIQRINGTHTNMQQLTQQIADYLRIAVSKGLINQNVVNQPMPRESLLLLNQLLSRVPRLDSAQQELAQYRSLAPAEQQHQQESITRLVNEIQGLQSEINEMQRKINASAPIPTPAAQAAASDANVGSNGSGSKLKHWTGEGSGSKSLGGPLEGDQLASQLGSLGLDSVNNPWGSGKLNVESLVSGAVDWSPPTNQPAAAQDNASDAGSSTAKAASGQGPSSTGGEGNSTTASDKEKAIGGGDSPDRERSADKPDLSIQEFVPGKPWNWRDPNEVASDPNATPGTLKQNPFSVGSFANLVNQSGSASGAFSTGHSTPTKQLNDPRGFGIGMSPNSAGGIDVWPNQQRSRPPSNLGQPFAANSNAAAGQPANRMGPAYGRTMSSPGGPQGAFQPMPQGPSFYVIMRNFQQTNEQMLRQVCTSAGKLLHFQPLPQQNALLVRYQDTGSGPGQTHNRLQQELAPHGVQLSVLKEQEVEQIMGAGQQQQQQQQRMPPPGGWPQSDAAPAGNWANPPGLIGDMLGMPPPSMPGMEPPSSASGDHPF